MGMFTICDNKDHYTKFVTLRRLPYIYIFESFYDIYTLKITSQLKSSSMPLWCHGLKMDLEYLNGFWKVLRKSWEPDPISQVNKLVILGILFFNPLSALFFHKEQHVLSYQSGLLFSWQFVEFQNRFRHKTF